MFTINFNSLTDCSKLESVYEPHILQVHGWWTEHHLYFLTCIRVWSKTNGDRLWAR